eukprot:365165-Chlamydomonas_euryale.AAC.9
MCKCGSVERVSATETGSGDNVVWGRRVQATVERAQVGVDRRVAQPTTFEPFPRASHRPVDSSRSCRTVSPIPHKYNGDSIHVRSHIRTNTTTTAAAQALPPRTSTTTTARQIQTADKPFAHPAAAKIAPHPLAQDRMTSLLCALLLSRPHQITLPCPHQITLPLTR